MEMEHKSYLENKLEKYLEGTLESPPDPFPMSEAGPSKPKPEPDHTQTKNKTLSPAARRIRNRRLLGLLAILVVIFLLSSSCASCIRCACDLDGNPAVTETATTQTTTVSGEPVETEPTQAPTEAEILPDEYLVSTVPDAHQIQVTPIKQAPELPTGAEVTSLTMVLNHLGFSVKKENLANRFLTCAEPGMATFSQAFIGSPFDENGKGCFAPVIASTAKKYLSAQESGRYVKILNDPSMDDLLLEVASNHPVIVWVSHNLEEVKEEYCYTIYGDDAKEFEAAQTQPVTDEDGKIIRVTTSETTMPPRTTTTAASRTPNTDVYWFPNETCVVLTGYDKTNNMVTVNDPSYGKKNYDMGLFKTSFNALYKQAIIIY